MTVEIVAAVAMEVCVRHAQALAYVWGRRDSGDTRVGSVEFANAYLLYRANPDNPHVTLQDAYRSFAEYGEIRRDL